MLDKLAPFNRLPGSNGGRIAFGAFSYDSSCEGLVLPCCD